mgnify:CR=1 FL=1
MKILITSTVVLFALVGCEVDQEPDVVASPQTVSEGANGGVPDVAPADPQPEPERRIGIDVNRDGADIEYVDDNVDVNVGSGD